MEVTGVSIDWKSWSKTWKPILVAIGLIYGLIVGPGIFFMNLFIHQAVDDSIGPLEQKVSNMSAFDSQVRGALNHYHEDVNRFFQRSASDQHTSRIDMERPYAIFNSIVYYEHEIKRSKY